MIYVVHLASFFRLLTGTVRVLAAAESSVATPWNFSQDLGFSIRHWDNEVFLEDLGVFWGFSKSLGFLGFLKFDRKLFWKLFSRGFRNEITNYS